MLNQKHSVTCEELNITFETGYIAKQANGAVNINLGKTSVFVAVTAADTLRSEDQDFFPLTVDYRERFSAAGRFPGGFFKREGRPSEKEILTSRLCDRPLRPLFPKGFLFEVQVFGMLLSADLVNEADILFVNGASAALALSDIPWNGPIGCIRLGQINSEFIVNPTQEQQRESDLDLVYVGNEEEMMMIEGSAKEIPEDRFIEALAYAHENVRKIITTQKELIEKVGKTKKTFDLVAPNDEALSFTRELIGEKLREAVFQSEKKARDEAVKTLKEEAEEALKQKMGEDEYESAQLNMIFEVLQEELYRGEILKSGKRVDSRGPKDLRPIEAHASVLPCVHGSAVFQRGETQSLVITTLGSADNAQESDGITGGSDSKSFILHYNFPPYSVGEVGRNAGPGRREIGHGALAERSLLPVMPPEEEFPYAIRLVSEIMESNGSTSMASVCGGCLSLMDAGVPIRDIVAGISVGLVTDKDPSSSVINQYVTLTDIIGSEDHFGDMDFKICGTQKGITGFQLDLKISGLPMNITKEAIEQNRIARMAIIEVMQATLSSSRPELSPNAPRIHQMQIDPEKIGALIGPGGKNIRRICQISGAEININENNSGRVAIYSSDQKSLERAVEEIELSCGEIELGKNYRGVVRGIKPYGIFVECLPGKEGFVHISELADFHVEQTEDVCQMGDEMWVKCIGIDEQGRVRLSRRFAIAEREAIERGEPVPEFKFPPMKPPRQNSDKPWKKRSDGENDRRGGRRERRQDGCRNEHRRSS